MKEVPDNMVLLQRTNGVASHAACVDGSEWHGFMFAKPLSGKWVSTRKLSDWEITQVEDQRDSGKVIENPCCYL